jgi:hypothetical protein
LRGFTDAKLIDFATSFLAPNQSEPPMTLTRQETRISKATIWIGVALALYQAFDTNFCFSELRYIPKAELCEAARKKVAHSGPSDDHWCVVEHGSFSAYTVTVDFANRANRNDPLWVEFDRCGGQVRTPH